MTHTNTTRGFIALMATIITSIILTTMMFVVSTSSFYARSDALGGEAKRISLGLAESCSNMALLHIAQNYEYDQVVTASGGEEFLVGTDAQGFEQRCKVKSITVSSSTATQKTLVIGVQAEYRGSFSNITTGTTVYNPNAIKIPKAYITVSAVVGPGGALAPSDFPLFLDGVSVTSGQTVPVTPNNAHTVTRGVTPAGYVTDDVWIGCSGGSITPPPGSSNSCTIYFTVVPTKATLTLIANIPVGANPTNFPLTITRTGSSTPMGTLTSGVPTTTSPGSYTLGYSMPVGYTSGGWDCPGPLNLLAGQIQYCTVTFTQPSPSCADTVVMLDRSGSMFDNSQWIPDEKKAAKSLLDLYKTVSPIPLVGIGRFGDVLTGNGAEIIPGANATNVYGNNDATSTIVGPQFPGGGGGPQNWNQPNQGLTNNLLYTTSVVNAQEQGFGYYGVNIPAGVTIDGIEVKINGKATIATTLGVELSWNDGATSTVTGKTISLTTTATTSTLGGPTDKWGRTTISPSEFVDGKFIVKLRNNAPNGQTTSVDYTTVRVWYSVPATGLYAAINTGLPEYQQGTTNRSWTNLDAAITAGKNELLGIPGGRSKVLVLISDGLPTKSSHSGQTAQNGATLSANEAKASGIKIFTIHFGDTSGRNFLAQLATASANDHGSDTNAENTDSDSFFISPTSAEMTTIFQVVGSAACPALTTATQAHLNVVTTVINNDGGLQQPEDFTVEVTGGTPLPNTFAGSTLGTSVSVTPGVAVTVTQTGPTGYFSPYYSNCTNVTVAAGETKTCTIVRDDTPAPLPPPANPPPPSDIDISSWIETATTTP